MELSVGVANEHRREDRPLGAPRGLERPLPAEGLARAVVAALLGNEHAHKAQKHGHEKAGDYTGDEHVTHARSGGDGVDDHRVRRRDHNAERTARGRYAGGEALVVSGLDHQRDCKTANGCCAGRAGAGERGEERAHKDAHDGIAAGKTADRFLRKAEKPVGDLALLHEDTGENKAGDRNQRERVQTVEHALRDGDRGEDVVQLRRDDGRETEHAEHRNADGKADNKYNDKQHVLSPFILPYRR